MEPFYYSKMNKMQQSVYHAMKAGLLALSPSFSVPRLEGRELSEIFFKLRLDCPEIFYAVSFRYRFYPDSPNAEVIPEYLFDKGKVKDHQKAMKSRVEKLVRPAAKMTEQEKELYIHDFICNHVHYDKLKKPYSHEIIGPLGQGVGVCEGIAKTVKVLCDALGIWCIIAISDANPDKKIKYRHAWNILRIDGKMYHMDATFDNTLSRGIQNEAIRYDYFNLDDSRFFRDHEPVMYPVVPCGQGDKFYYREKKLSFTKLEEIEKRATQAAKKGKTLIFHWRGGYMTREVVTEVINILKEAAEKKEKHMRVSLNWHQAVFYVQFLEGLEEGLETTGGDALDQVTIEEANEGET